MKSEPDVFSVEHLKKMGRAPWDGVRNFQARNNMKSMQVGDRILFYHSSTDPAGVAGEARVVREAYPDFTAWDKKSEYFDLRSRPERPMWMMVDVEYVETYPRLVSLAELKADPSLAKMLVVRKGMRLSVQPVDEQHFQHVRALAKKSRR